MNSSIYTKIDGKYYKDNPEAQRLRNPRTNSVSRMVYKDAGGYESFYDLPKNERLRLRIIAGKKYDETVPFKKESLKDIIYNIAPDRPVYPSVKELRQRIPRPVSEKNPGGFVYIFKDKMKADGYYKIGSTHDLNDRLGSGRTWGAIELVAYFETDDRRKLEKDVHNLLDKWNVKEYDIGREWFNIPENIAIEKIQELIDAAQEQEMGEQKVS